MALDAPAALEHGYYAQTSPYPDAARSEVTSTCAFSAEGYFACRPRNRQRDDTGRGYYEYPHEDARFYLEQTRLKSASLGL
jgi:hypothetical protein